MRCYNCESIAKLSCSQCDQFACRNHSNVTFNEQSRGFVNLCGVCYSSEAQNKWGNGKS